MEVELNGKQQTQSPCRLLRGRGENTEGGKLVGGKIGDCLSKSGEREAH